MPGCAIRFPQRSYRAPAADGTALLVPGETEWRSLWNRNLQQRLTPGRTLDGVDLETFRSAARQEMLEDAVRYSSGYADPPPVAQRNRVVMAGHQPELIHPGVWFKNVVLSRFAEQVRAVPLNLIVDNDVLTTASIRVPTGSLDAPRVESIAFDHLQRHLPYEMAGVQDRTLFASFPDRINQAMISGIGRPLVESFWPRVLSNLSRTCNLGWSFAAARHQWELEQGLQTLELPVSQFSQSEWFCRFVADLLTRIAEFHRIHNGVLAEYRRCNRLRGTGRPVPDLSQEGENYESPFWIWSAADPVRGRLFVRTAGSDMILSDQNKGTRRIPLRSLGEGLLEWQRSGWAIRPRAITNTIYARLILSDLFIHGIGGAKYDEVTDQIIQQFYQTEPPDYATVTATRRLPYPLPEVDADDLRIQERRLRDLRYHPEIFFAASNESEIENWIAQKRRWIANDDPDQRKIRHDRIEEANRELALRLKPKQLEMESLRDQSIRDLHIKKLLGSREFSFVLFPETLLASLIEMAPSV